MATSVSYLTSAVDGGDWGPSHRRQFIPGTRWIADWVGPRFALNMLQKNVFLCWESKASRLPPHSPDTIMTELIS